jgi:hypothetical protein
MWNQDSGHSNCPAICNIANAVTRSICFRLGWNADVFMVHSPWEYCGSVEVRSDEEL